MFVLLFHNCCRISLIKKKKRGRSFLLIAIRANSLFSPTSTRGEVTWQMIFIRLKVTIWRMKIICQVTSPLVLVGENNEFARIAIKRNDRPLFFFFISEILQQL